MSQTARPSPKCIKDYLAEVDGPRKMTTAVCIGAIEELAPVIDFIDIGAKDMTPEQREIWERYKAQTVQFIDDMLLADGNLPTIRRRLNLPKERKT